MAGFAAASPRFRGRLATAVPSPCTGELPDIDARAIEQPGMRDAFLASYAEAFRRGSWEFAPGPAGAHAVSREASVRLHDTTECHHRRRRIPTILAEHVG